MRIRKDVSGAGLPGGSPPGNPTNFRLDMTRKQRSVQKGSTVRSRHTGKLFKVIKTELVASNLATVQKVFILQTADGEMCRWSEDYCFDFYFEWIKVKNN